MRKYRRLLFTAFSRSKRLFSSVVVHSGEKTIFGQISNPLASFSHDSLINRQVLLEEQQESLAAVEQDEIISEMAEFGRGTSRKFVQKSLVKWYDPFKNALELEIQCIFSGDANMDRTRYGPLLLLLPVDKLAVLTLDATLAAVMKSGNNGISTSSIAMEIGSLVETEVNLRKIKDSKEPSSFWVRRLLREKPQETLQLYHKIRKVLRDIDLWTPDVKVKIGALLLKTMINSVKDETGENIFTLRQQTLPGTARKVGFIQMSNLAYSSISKSFPSIIQPRYLPMLVPPQPWNNSKYFGAYLHLRAPLLKFTSKAQIEAVKKARMDKVLRGLDYLGSIPWKINKKILSVINEAVLSGKHLGEIPSSSDLEILSMEEYFRTHLPTVSSPPSKENIREYYKWKSRLEKRNSELHSLRCDMKIKLSIANQFLEDIIYFPHHMDFRGRAYPIPPNLNHLGSDLCRSLLVFADKKPLGDLGFYWLKVHLANLWGNNKISFEDRVKWTESNKELIYDSAQFPLTGKMWWVEAESPFQALATCVELFQAWTSPNPTEYLCGLPVHQDGSCNGLQHYAGLGRDEAGGAAVNLVRGPIPSDVYSRVLDIVKRRVDTDCSIPDDHPDPTLAKKGRYARLIKPVVSRKVIKQTVMTSVYGVTKIGARAQVLNRLTEVLVKDPTHISFNEEQDLYWAAHYLAGLTLESLDEMFESAKKIMDWLAEVSNIAAEQGQVMSWITPLGLPVMQPYRMEANCSINTVLQSVQLVVESEFLPVSKKKQRTAFPPNFVHSLDSTHMILTCLKMKERGITFAAVHDSYWTHACDVPVMNKILRESFVELYSQTILEDLHHWASVRFPQAEIPALPKRGSLDITKVLDSTYFFH